MASQTISKRQNAQRIASQHGIGQKKTLRVMQAFLDTLIDELAQGHRLEFRDFGVFELVVCKARTAMNPKTLERIQVGSKSSVKFKVSSLLKERVNALLAAESDAAAPRPDPGSG